jgi:hypothetical protein
MSFGIDFAGIGAQSECMNRYRSHRDMIDTPVYVLEDAQVLAGKVTQVDTDGNAQVLLADGRTVIRDAAFGVFQDEGYAGAMLAEING